MGVFGNLLGQGLGNLAGGLIGHGKEGQTIGGTLGGFLPFKKGIVRVNKKTQKAILHRGEMVVPAKLTHLVSKSLKEKIKKNSMPKKGRK